MLNFDLSFKAMVSLADQLRETITFIRSKVAEKPFAGIVLGSGLGNFSTEMNIDFEIAYNDIPHFPVSTVEGHYGKLIFGSMSGKKVVAMSGRFHFYEGYTARDVAYPIRVLKFLGIDTLLISNAAGGLNPRFRVGDLMIIQDHISMFTANPLLGTNLAELGPRFPDMSEPYAKYLVSKAEKIAETLDIDIRLGVYAGVTGPTFETRAEYKMLRLLGADAVGMSTVQEVIVARHMGLPVFAMSVIADIGIRDDDNIITHAEVLQEAKDAEPKLTAIFKQLIEEL